ncbi:hypothetical protein CWE12_09285 [Aliidiomarina sedimenti]|uniref:Peptidase M48 domain-containing protein n=1 Tax=Aliidiomarina sedimenti TaxID=1933879 RepID=A0ABY0BXF7_9GAMM|nr:hypothetical protein [Aliidiomarina sedimenti]RUO29170.1 hypothetical protein CWE12_09285 [Aliidiomarina sedimenti]
MKSIAWRSLLISSLLISWLAACSSQIATENETQRELVEHAQYIERAAAQAEELWPDFWSANTPFIVYFRQGPALLVSEQVPEGDYQQLSERYYYYEDSLPRLSDSFHIDYQAGDIVATAVSLQSSPQDTLSLLFHEAFHGYQRSHFSRTAVAEFVDPDAFKNPQVRALLQLRRDLLEQALDAPVERVPGLLDDLLTIDHLLVMQMGAEPMERMHQLEIIEGTAEYIGLTAGRLVHPRFNVTRRVKDHLQVNPEGVHNSSNLRRYSYGTGAAQVILATRLEQDAQQQINDASSLNALLAEWRQFEEPDEARINDLLARYPIEALVEWAYQQSSPDQALNLEQFAALTEATLDFAIHLKSKQATAGLDVNFSSGTGGFTQPQQGSYVLPQPQSISIYGNMTKLLIEGAATHMQSPGDESPVLRLQVKVDSLPVLCDGNESCQLESIDFTWQGIEFSHAAETSVRQQGSHLHIDVTEL